MGTCTGVASTCAGAGYALESRCHVGKIIKYDTVKKLGWRVNVQNHPINVVIDLLSREEDWEGARQVPQAVDEDEDCVVSTVCFVIATLLTASYRTVSNGSISSAVLLF